VWRLCELSLLTCTVLHHIANQLALSHAVYRRSWVEATRWWFTLLSLLLCCLYFGVIFCVSGLQWFIPKRSLQSLLLEMLLDTLPLSLYVISLAVFIIYFVICVRNEAKTDGVGIFVAEKWADSVVRVERQQQQQQRPFNGL